MRDMLGRQEAVSVQEALELIRRNLPDYHPPETGIPIESSSGSILSRDIVSPEDLPGFSRSTVDGYAVRSADTFGANENSPAYLKITHDILMGDEPGFDLREGEAARIATGGMLPRGADSVVMLEHAQSAAGEMLEVQRAVAPADNVIGKGDDVKKGERLLEEGRKLRPHDVAALAGIGITRVFVYERPPVAIIATGDEVVPAATTPLRAGLIRDMNSYNLAALLQEEGALPVPVGIVKDDFKLLKAALEQSIKGSSMVLITGGSSVGAKDMTARVLEDLGRVIFHYVSIKPGKPTLFGLAGDVPVFGLPGHPGAVAVCFDVFVRVVLRHLGGQRFYTAREKYGRRVRAKLAKSIRSEIGKEQRMSVSLKEINGELHAVPLPGKSGLIAMLIKGDGTVAVPAGSPGLRQGELVEVRLL